MLCLIKAPVPKRKFFPYRPTTPADSLLKSSLGPKACLSSRNPTCYAQLHSTVLSNPSMPTSPQGRVLNPKPPNPSAKKSTEECSRVWNLKHASRGALGQVTRQAYAGPQTSGVDPAPHPCSAPPPRESNPSVIPLHINVQHEVVRTALTQASG